MPRRYDDDPSNLDRIGAREKRVDDRPDPEERQKKSWREIDQKRDGSVHRREERAPGQPRAARPESKEYRAYKSQLDKLFSGGPLPEGLKSKMEEAGIGLESKARKEAAQAILDAKPARARLQALATYREAHGFPREEAVLASLLELDDPPVVREALQTIESLLEEGQLKRASSLKGRINTAKMTADDDEVVEIAKRLLRRL